MVTAIFLFFQDAFAQEMKNICNLLFIINPPPLPYPYLQQKKVERINPIFHVPAMHHLCPDLAIPLWHQLVCIIQHLAFNIMEITPNDVQFCLLTVNYERMFCPCGSHHIHLCKQIKLVGFCTTYQ